MLSIFLSKRKIQGLLLGLMLIASLVTGSAPVVQAQGGAPALFSDADAAAAADIAWDAPVYVARSRYVHINTSLLLRKYSTKQDIQSNPEISFNLFGDTNYTGVVTKVTKTDTGYSWVGRLKEKENGYFYLLTYQDVFIAHVASADGVYEVSSANNDLYRVVQLDQSKFMDEPPGTVLKQLSGPNDLLQKSDLSAASDSAARIDVMVVYTSAARVAAGSTAKIKARIALALLQTNTSYANAGISTRLRLVHVHEIAYAESSSLAVNLTRLIRPTDGYLDEVHTLRNTYGADMVSLVLRNGGGYCGMAAGIKATAAKAFQVVQLDGCMTGYYSFGHEFGHLQGARHDVYADPTMKPFSYGHGYVYLPALWRTVMAYDAKCNAIGYTCKRLQYWSNPSKNRGGVPMGDVYAKNYQVLNKTALTVANFRVSKIPSDFNSTFNTSSNGWTPVSGSWVLASSAYYTTLGITSLVSSIQHAGTYGDVTYEVRMRREGCASCGNNLFIRGNPLSLNAYNDWNSSYLFQYTNTGYFSIDRVESSGGYTNLFPWTFRSEILVNDWNTLKVIAVGSSLRFYINNVMVASLTDTSFGTGNLGIGMYMDGVSTGNVLYVDSAKASTTATADFLPSETVVPDTTGASSDPHMAP